MTSDFQHLCALATTRLAEFLLKAGRREFDADQLAELISRLTGASVAVAETIVDQFMRDGLVQQSRAITSDHPGSFTIQPGLFHAADRLKDDLTTPKLSFTQFRDQLLLALADKNNSDGPNYYDLKEVADSKRLKYRPGWVRQAAYYFRDRGYIREAFTMGGGEDGNLEAEISADGLSQAEEIQGQAGTRNQDRTPPEWDKAIWDEVRWPAEDAAIPSGQASAKPAVVGSAVIGSAIVGEIPASDRTVSLDHNSREYQDTVASLDKVIVAFRDDHRLDNELGREKPALLKTLEAGRELLTDARVRVVAAVTVIVNPLRILIEKYHREIVGALAATALSLVLNLLGIGPG
jgi:hypothetical protein